MAREGSFVDKAVKDPRLSYGFTVGMCYLPKYDKSQVSESEKTAAPVPRRV